MNNEQHKVKGKRSRREDIKALANEYVQSLPDMLAEARANGKMMPFYIRIDPKTGETLELLFGQEALDASAKK